MNHRTDIDGLRAIAVLAVFATHLELAGFSGGFVGVDVFFVISGYVIALTATRRQAAGGFSLVDFWERRLRRLTPALFVALAATTAMVMAYMFPATLQSYANSLLATLVYGSNIFFWLTTDYFAAPPDAYPLLHTWSLAVEGQFYLAFPLVLMAGWKWFPTRIRTVLAVIAAASFALGVYMADHHPVASFYLPFGRAWELLIGALLAMGLIPHARGPKIKLALSLLGLAAIAYATVFYTEGTHMPGLAAVLPCAGALALLAAAEDTPVGRLLSLPPMRFFGEISYSLYLWHWPLISAQRTLFGAEAGGWLAPVIVFALATLLAWLSYRFIEVPFRRRPQGQGPGRFYAIALAAMLVIAAPAAAALAFKGLPDRFSPEVQALAASGERTPRRHETCLPWTTGDLTTFPAVCVAESPDKANWLLAGDSYANHLWFGLSSSLPTVNLMQAAHPACRMTLTPRADSTDQCRRLNAALYQDLLINRPPRQVILAGLWRKEDAPALAETLRWYKARGIPVVLVGPTPVYEQFVPELLALSKRFGDPGLVARRREPDAFAAEPVIAAVARQEGIPYLSVISHLCPGGDCVTMTPEGKSMQFDRNHFSRTGSLWIGRRLVADPAFPRP